MTVNEWKRRVVEHFKSGAATDEQWGELADVLLGASEGEGLELIDDAIWTELNTPAAADRGRDAGE